MLSGFEKKYRSMDDEALAEAASKLHMGHMTRSEEPEDRETVVRLLAQRDVFRAVTVIMTLAAGVAFLGIISPLVTLAA